jgi:spermidine synthase
MILAVIFGAGAVLMATEILALRIVAKNFGSALREVSAVIAVFLTAMSAGYAVGGRIGDRRPLPSTLAAVLILAGLLTLLIPVLEEPVANAIFDSALPFALHAAAVSIALFAMPAFLCASVTPIGTRLRMRSVDQSGSVAGGVSAVSAMGSIVGTISAGYILLSYLPVSRALVLLGCLLCVLGLLAGRGSRSTAGLALIAALMPTVTLADSPRVIFERDTSYHHITVRESDTRRTLHFDNTLQGSISLTDPTTGAIPYTYSLHTALVIEPGIRSVLVIGLGSATVPRLFLHYYPKAKVWAAEIDPVVVEVAKQYFGMTDDPRLTVETIDGRVFLKRSREQFDLIFLDAFGANRYGLTVPPHLATREFLEEAKSRLTPNGILVYNSPYALGNPFANAIYKTIASVFPERFIFDTQHSNIIIMATKTPCNLSRNDLLARGKAAMDAGTLTYPSLMARLEQLIDAPAPDTIDAPLLTDDFAPVDRLLRTKR